MNQRIALNGRGNGVFSRYDYCAYVVSTGVEAQPCVYCSSPVVREFPDDEDPLYPGQECGTCNEVFHRGYDAALGRERPDVVQGG